MKGLTATSSKVSGTAITGSAWVGQPSISTELIKAGGMMPNLFEMALPDIFKVQRRYRLC
jgi:hypothetical protein